MLSIPAKIMEQVDTMTNLEINYRNLHVNANLYDDASKTNIVFPFNSITTKYSHYLEKILIEIPLDDTQKARYMYQPKKVSEELYDTTEFWNDILLLNGCKSTFDFKPTILKAWDPNHFKSYLNEFLVIEDSIDGRRYLFG